MTSSLEIGLEIAHFRIIAPLGQGGMGEVYKAWDSRLERAVALKVLPPDKVRDEERLRRFVQEAKSASALAHPNIVTIHEIGHEEVIGEGGAPTQTVHYIAMELVDGATLKQLVHEPRADLRTLLGYLAQAAEGISRAHEAGVVHRDLKPENIMVSRDGYAKVLDFGLAKLDTLADPGDGLTSATTAYEEATAEGMMMGTVGYMSPEQAYGRAVDHRTDIFAFGCLLYEAATRRRPFAADSSIDVLHKIVHDQPPPMEEINPEVPGALRRLVRRCLVKDPERRAQSMKDVALELSELVAEFDSLSPSTSSGISRSGLSGPRLPLRRSGRWRWAALAAVGLGLAAGGWWLATRGGEPAAGSTSSDAFQTMEIEPLTSEGTILLGALSPDGRYLAHTRSRDGLVGLWIRQVATGSEVEVVPPADLWLRDVAFTPDGDYLYFVRDVPDRPGFGALYRVPTLGGEARQIAFDVDAGVTFSPDGSRFAFPRGIPHEDRSVLMVARADGSNLAELASLELPERFALARAAWSPAGDEIVALVVSAEEPLWLRPMAVDVGSGALSPFPGDHRFTAFAGVGWLPDGSGLVVVGRREMFDSGDQIWLIGYPRGALRRISNDVNDYGPPSVSADGTTLATVLAETESQVYALPAATPGEVRQLTSGRRELVGDVAAGRDGAVVFVRRQGERISLWKTTVGGEARRLTTEGVAFDPALSADGRILLACLVLGADERPHVWRLDPESGARLEQLTDGQGETGLTLSPDGAWFYYSEIGSPALWRRAVAGGEPVRVAARGGTPRVSPDGRQLAYAAFEQIDGQPRPVLTIATLEGEVVQRLPWQLDRFLWHPSGDSLVVDRDRERVGNLWKVPLDGSEPEQITAFDRGFILDADWSPDGEWIFVTRGETTSDVVLVRDFH